DSAAKRARAASAAPVRPATRPAPPAAAANLSSCARSSCRSNGPSITTVSFLVARRTDDPHDLCGDLPRVGDAVRHGTAVGDADAEAPRDALKRADAGTGAAAFHLREKALAQPGAVRDLAQGAPAARTNQPEALSDVDVVRCVRRARRHPVTPSDPIEENLSE